MLNIIRNNISILLVISLLLASPAWAEVVVNMDRIAEIESSWDADAYNRHSQARGLYQVTPVCLKDFNRLNKAHYRPKELFDPQVNARVAHWYMNKRIPALLRHFGHRDTVEHRLVAYNAGVRALKRKYWPVETVAYIRKYKQAA